MLADSVSDMSGLCANAAPGSSASRITTSDHVPSFPVAAPSRGRGERFETLAVDDAGLVQSHELDDPLALEPPAARSG